MKRKKILLASLIAVVAMIIIAVTLVGIVNAMMATGEKRDVEDERTIIKTSAIKCAGENSTQDITASQILEKMSEYLGREEITAQENQTERTIDITYQKTGRRYTLYIDSLNVTGEELEDGPYLPTGFSHVGGTTLDNGYTIQDSTGNQYVWVEVPKTDEVYPTAGLNITEFTETEYTAIETDLHTYTNDYRDGSYKDEYYSDETTGLTSTQYAELKKKMLKSVYQNGGFYVGKYETGIEDAPKTSGSSSTAPTQTPVIKQNAYPYNYVTCSQAQTLASNMESGSYTTSLLFGVQWDLVLKYLETKGTAQADLKTNSTSWGNYSNNLYNIINVNSKYSADYGSNWKKQAYGRKTSNLSILLSTGASDEFSKQGIYDLAGNVWERTLEYTSYSSVPCATRGGCYNNSGGSIPASYRSGANTTGCNLNLGFRVALF